MTLGTNRHCRSKQSWMWIMGSQNPIGPQVQDCGTWGEKTGVKFSSSTRTRVGGWGNSDTGHQPTLPEETELDVEHGEPEPFGPKAQDCGTWGARTLRPPSLEVWNMGLHHWHTAGRKDRGEDFLFKKNKGGWAGAKYMPARQVIRTVATKRTASSKHARAPPSPHPKGGREGGASTKGWGGGNRGGWGGG